VTGPSTKVGLVAATAWFCAGGCGSATFVHVTVDGPSGLTALWIDLDFDATHRQVTHQPLTHDGAVPSLPASFGVKLPDLAGTLSITVTGQRGTGNLLTATRAVVVTPHRSQDVEIALDGGVPDLASTRDLTPPPDLRPGTPDLLPAPDVCQQSGGATACAGGGYILCDGFEGDSGAMFAGWTNGTTMNGTVAAVAMPVCRGKTALQAHAVGGAQAARLYRNTLTLGTAAYVRAFLYLPSATDWTTLSYGNFFELGDGVGGTVNLRFGGTPGKVYVERSFVANPPETGMLLRDRWICLEMYVLFSKTNGRVTVFTDETMIGDYPSSPTLNPASFSPPNYLSVGENGTLAGSTGTIDVYFDEVVVSSTPIGCH
jgi:hypothetical protein